MTFTPFNWYRVAVKRLNYWKSEKLKALKSWFSYPFCFSSAKSGCLLYRVVIVIIIAFVEQLLYASYCSIYVILHKYMIRERDRFI